MKSEKDHILPDVLDPHLKLVICGTAAGNKSASEKAYYAGFGNWFYPTMAYNGFTPCLLRPKQYREMLNYGIGFTDLAKFTHGIDRDLKDDDHDPISFEEKILKFQPQVVCFNGKKAASIYFGKKLTHEVSYGLQKECIGVTKLFVAPSTSCDARRHWDESYWQQLKELIVW